MYHLATGPGTAASGRPRRETARDGTAGRALIAKSEPFSLESRAPRAGPFGTGLAMTIAMIRPFVAFAFPVAPTLFLFLALASGCSSGPESYSEYDACLQAESASLAAKAGTKSAPQGPFTASLLETQPDALTVAIKDGLRKEMRISVEHTRASRIASLRCDHLRPKRSLEAARGGAPSAAADGSSSSSGGGGARSVSGTNNQVAGVDEADFVKNDNEYIYVVSGSHLRIIEAWPAPDAREIANVKVPGQAKKLFVEGDRAVVYSSTPKEQGSNESGDAAYAGARGTPSSSSGDCTYGYDGCVPAGDGTETEISIFDITDRAAPKLVRSIHSSSSLVAARRIGSAVHTVLGEPSSVSVGWTSYPNGLSYDPEKISEAQVNAAFDALLAENEKKIDAVDTRLVLPRWSDSAGRAPEQSLYQSAMPDGTALTSVLSIDLASDPTIKVASVIGRPGWVYASADALYVAVPHRRIRGWGWYEGRTEDELSMIHKFAVGTTPRDTRYVATGVVKGRVLNQFALDEHEGFLRVATTTGSVPNAEVHSTISVLESSAGHLGMVGQIDQIAPTEDIRSVRFDGARGYVVTFKKTDPLFVFDLANPRAPRTLGELKIPGFSTYMHMMDATHLLTIGYDAADHGSFAFFTGVLLQIFDVSNPSEPKLAHKEVIGTRGSSSEALTNHLAFNYFAPKNLLAVPMTVCEGSDGSNGQYGDQMTFSGLMVYDTTVAQGFSLRGKVAHPNSSQTGDSQNGWGYYDTGCSNWWTNATSEVKRSIIMDDYVFSVSDTRIKINDLRDLGADIRELPLQ